MYEEMSRLGPKKMDHALIRKWSMIVGLKKRVYKQFINFTLEFLSVYQFVKREQNTSVPPILRETRQFAQKKSPSLRETKMKENTP